MIKIKRHIKIVAVACFIVIFSISALMLSQKNSLSEKDFPLELDFDKTVFNVGEKISFNATIINKSGKDVDMFSNGEQPGVIFRNVNDNRTYGETCQGVKQIFQAEEKITRFFEYEASEIGTYIVDACYRITVDNIWIHNKIDDIIIEVR
ncbi:MAG: hypothetical protein NUK63_04105 [Candidatus Bathyarchaeum tardum]|nr:MAG: hypothetical protein NUK63_04105 [Candidatus Bathyarchaeum tardum]